jgi:hypothetical protein
LSCHSSNKWEKIRQALDNARKALETAYKNTPGITIGDWDNLNWPQPWSAQKYKEVRDYCLKEITDHEDGRSTEICGGPKQREMFDSLIAQAIERND